MNKYQKAFETITNTLVCYMLRRDLYPMPSDEEKYGLAMKKNMMHRWCF